MNSRENPPPNSSWEHVAKWYDRAVGETGLYYHRNVIIPKLLSLMDLEKEKEPAVLDLACGQGILSRSLPKRALYLGVDLSKSLITAAKNRSKNPNHQFQVYNLLNEISLDKNDFTHACLILALQNMEEVLPVLRTACRHLKKGGKIFLVLNHPCFRIPRQSSWQTDLQSKIQYRRIDRYLSPLKIPILASPSGRSNEKMISFHNPISYYINKLSVAKFVITGMEEWCSDKTSTGKCAPMENRARKEFPLFLTITAIKLG